MTNVGDIRKQMEGTNILKSLSFINCPGLGNVVLGKLLHDHCHLSLESLSLNNVNVNENVFLSVSSSTLLNIRKLVLSMCPLINLKVYTSTIYGNNTTKLSCLILKDMMQISIQVLHKLLSTQTLHIVEMEHCCFTNLMFRELPCTLNRLILKDMVPPASKFIYRNGSSKTLSSMKQKKSIVIVDQKPLITDKTPLWVKQLLKKTINKHDLQKDDSDIEGTTSKSNMLDVKFNRDHSFIDRNGIESLFNHISLLTYVDIEMPHEKEQSWFLKRRNKYFEDRNINDYPILERDETWQVKKSIKTTSALLPVSLVGKKETNINASGLKSFYDKDPGDHRGVDWYKQNVKNKLTLLKGKRKSSFKK